MVRVAQAGLLGTGVHAPCGGMPRSCLDYAWITLVFCILIAACAIPCLTAACSCAKTFSAINYLAGLYVLVAHRTLGQMRSCMKVYLAKGQMHAQGTRVACQEGLDLYAGQAQTDHLKRKSQLFRIEPCKKCFMYLGTNTNQSFCLYHVPSFWIYTTL